MGQAIAHDPQFTGHRGDSTGVVVERVAEVAQTFGEDAQLGLRIAGGVCVRGLALEPVDLLKQDRPLEALQVWLQGGGDDRFESSRQVLQATVGLLVGGQGGGGLVSGHAVLRSVRGKRVGSEPGLADVSRPVGSDTIRSRTAIHARRDP